ncbi:MAG TPA: hypothetical protein VMH02_07115 [Verrucomicrobiae bacterium]|nr:hypothetical protein [Verrucomicrobiae bacterium]
MITATQTPSRLGRATLGSLLLHGLVVLCIPALAWTASTAPAVETVSFTQVTHIQVAPPHMHAQPQPRPQAPHLSLHPKVTLAAEHPELSRSSPRHSASPPPAIASAISAAPNLARASSAGDGTARAGQPDPQPSATPAERDVASVGKGAGGYLPFGAEQPDPVLDPAVLRALQALGVHLTLIVTVGEDGKTKAIVYDPQPDAALESRIASLLADANWDPAVCGGGVACQSHATIRL